MGKKVNVLVVDDEPHVRKFLRTLINSIGSCQVCAEATNGEEALEKFNQTASDLVLLDVNMPDLSGIDTLKQIKAIEPNISVLMVSSLADMQTVQECITLGANNYILKNNDPAMIRNIIREESFKAIKRKEDDDELYA